MDFDEKPKRRQSPYSARGILGVLVIVILLLFTFLSLSMSSRFSSVVEVRRSSIQVSTMAYDAFPLTATAIVQSATRDALEATAELNPTANGMFITFTPSPNREVKIPLALVINRNTLTFENGQVVEVVSGEGDALSAKSATMISVDGLAVTLSLPSEEAEAVEAMVERETRMYIALTR